MILSLLRRRRAPGQIGTQRPPGRPLFSILTTVYDTPVALLRAAARSVFRQTGCDFEWILMDNGSEDATVARTVRDIAAHHAVRYLSVSPNVGIVGGMRRCLEHASGEYVVPFDSDDLLAPDALRVIAREISAGGKPTFLYSDEDLIRGSHAFATYRRPDWDPVLNLTTSYVFHVSAFHRQRALELDVYWDAGANYCHDWDTVFRFSGAGDVPHHVPAVLYHWRMHEASSTNRASPLEASLASQRHVLERLLNARPDRSHFTIELFPISRGAPEWWVRRSRLDPPPVAAVIVGTDAASRAADLLGPSRYPFSEVALVGSPETASRLPDHTEVAANDGGRSRQVRSYAGDPLAGLRTAVRDLAAPFVFVCSTAVVPEGDEWPWETAGLRALHPDLALISGRILNTDRMVVAGGEIFGIGDVLGTPFRGMSENDPGPFGFALKRHSVSAVHPAFFLADTAFLVKALDSLPGLASLGFLGAWLGALAAEAGRRVVYSPMISAAARGVFVGDHPSASQERTAFKSVFRDLIPDTRWSGPYEDRLVRDGRAPSVRLAQR